MTPDRSMARSRRQSARASCQLFSIDQRNANRKGLTAPTRARIADIHTGMKRDTVMRPMLLVVSNCAAKDRITFLSFCFAGRLSPCLQRYRPHNGSHRRRVRARRHQSTRLYSDQFHGGPPSREASCTYPRIPDFPFHVHSLPPATPRASASVRRYRRHSSV